LEKKGVDRQNEQSFNETALERTIRRRKRRSQWGVGARNLPKSSLKSWRKRKRQPESSMKKNVPPKTKEGKTGLPAPKEDRRDVRKFKRGN